ncbi:MAG: hypothetical protein ACPG8W_01635 [Candidatus Promineifilaceae bacterium]
MFDLITHPYVLGSAFILLLLLTATSGGRHRSNQLTNKDMEEIQRGKE